MIRKDYLLSKIIVPPIFHKLLHRKKIADIIDNASIDEAICLIAPYGCGKTLSVISWLSERDLKAAWLTLDEMYNTEHDFFADLSAAIMHHTGWQGDSDDILADSKYAEDPQDYLWNAISEAERNGLDRVLVIDGLQFIRDPALLRSVKDMISALLGRWRVIVMSRSELPSIFNDLMLKRRICLITLTELSFSPEETAEFFSINGYDTAHQEVLRISEETEGWPAALNVVLTLSSGGSLCYGEAAREYVKGFFETEIWNDLNEDIKEFLLKTSVLEKGMEF